MLSWLRIFNDITKSISSGIAYENDFISVMNEFKRLKFKNFDLSLKELYNWYKINRQIYEK